MYYQTANLVTPQQAWQAFTLININPCLFNRGGAPGKKIILPKWEGPNPALTFAQKHIQYISSNVNDSTFIL